MAVVLRVLGPVELVGDEGPLLLPDKQRRLLAALAAAFPDPVGVGQLLEALWPQTAPPSAVSLVQVYVSQVRKLLGGDAGIRRRGVGYLLELDGEERLDARAFERLVAEARGAAAEGRGAGAVLLFRRGLSLWRGRAYGELADEQPLRGEAARLEELRLAALEERFELELALGRHRELVSELRSYAATEPLRERLQAQTMLALYRCGRQSEALELYTLTRRRLRDELGLEPGPELRDLQRRLLQQDPGLAPVQARPLAAAPLPAAAGELLGRERELAELRELLSSRRARLLVLAGAGGSGKTSLALEAARAAGSSFADGAAFVDLAPLRDPELVLATIAKRLGVPESGEDQLASLAQALRQRELLLVLDNAEHLHEAAPLYVELLARAAGLSLLVTSRVVLHLSGEHVYPVEPLAADDAAALFRRRAHEAGARLRLEEDDDLAVERICERLDGLPLAIELAAARTRTLAPAELLARLEPRLPLLTGGPRDLPARQQTLAATLAWSYELLDEPTRRDLHRLSVFAGGCTLEAAERVCGATVERLATLVDHNLLRRSVSEGESRYALLETIREDALERLDPDEADHLREAHAAYFLELAERAFPERLERPRNWLPRLEREQPNLRAALDCLAATDPQRTLQLAGALGWFWSFAGQFAEGRRRLAGALEHASGDQAVRARALAMGAQLLNAQGDLALARTWGEEAAALATDLGEPEPAAVALLVLAGICTHQGELEHAGRLLDDALAYARRLDQPTFVTRALAGACYALVCGGETDRAETTAHELLDEARAQGDEIAEANAFHYLGDCALQRGRCDLAEKRYRAALAAFWRLGLSNQAETELTGLAMALAGQARSREALRYAAAVKAHRAGEGVQPSVAFWEELQARYLGTARAALGSGPAEKIWHEGERLPIEAAITEALAT